MKAKEKRKVRGYKMADAPYLKAMKRATKEKLNLATLIEVWVIAYGNKDPFYISSEHPNNL